MIQKFLKDKIINIIFPQVCGICGRINKNSLCPKCEFMLKKYKDFKIEKILDRDFENLIYLFHYEGIIRQLILKYKFKEKAYLYKTFVNFLLKDEKIFQKFQTYDKIISVPISKKRNKQRGYNQSELIAKEIAKKINISYENNILYKVKDVVEQSKLSKEERIENIKSVYDIRNKENLENRKILLLDDIYTTGSTVQECCKILKQGKPKKIDVFVIAKD